MTSEQQQQRVSKVFISHSMSDGDGELASILARLLKFKRIRAYVAEEDRRWDGTVTNKISAELTESHCLVAILSQLGTQSASVNQEIGFAVSREIPMILMVEYGVQSGQLEFLHMDGHRWFLPEKISLMLVPRS